MKKEEEIREELKRTKTELELYEKTSGPSDWGGGKLVKRGIIAALEWILEEG